MTTHTKGPWTVRASVNGPYVARHSGSLGDAALAKVLKVSGRGRMLEREQEQLANARLMAAAPDLLAALTALRDNVEADLSGWWTESTSNFMQQADAAIAKADGQP